MRRFGAALACASAVAGTAAAQQPQFGPGAELKSLADRIVGGGVAAAGVPHAMVAVSVHGRRFFYRYGVGGDAPITRESIVEIGSITKVFTTTVLAEAFDARVIDPNGSIQAYLPGVRLQPCTARITPVQLADFSSGLPRDADAPQNLQLRGIDHYTERDFLRWASQVTPRTGCDLPASYVYSNASVGLLGPILANATRRPWQALVADEITRPLGMTDTGVAPPRAPQVQGHFADGRPAPRWPFFAWYAAGALRSTAQDMLAFGEAALGHEVVNGRPTPPALRQALRGAMRVIYRGGADGIALSWETQGDGTGGVMTFKNGGTDGFSSLIIIDPAKDCAVFIVADKQNTDVTGMGQQLMRAIGR